METIKKYRRQIIVLCALVICAAVVLGIVPVRLKAADAQTQAGELSKTGELQLTADPLAPEGMQRAADSDKLSLFINPQTGEISVYDKAADSYWSSNPTEQQVAASMGTGTVKSEMRSQVLLTYYDETDLLQYFNSYDHCTVPGNIAVSSIENGVAVTYKIGETAIDITMLPAAVEKDKFESLVLSKLSDGEAKKLIEKYYSLEVPKEGTEREKKKYAESFTNLNMNKEYYLLDLYAPNYVLEEMYNAIYKTADYTVDDFYADNEAVGYTAEVKTLLQVELTVEYTVADGEFKVRIPQKGISIPDNISVTELSILPFFGTAGRQDSGYMLIPDGSGALINLNNGRINTQAVSIPVYGKDTSVTKIENNISESAAYMPVYGMVRNGAAYLAVIEGGDTCARVCARISGMATDYNQLYPNFNILVMDPMVISTGSNPISTNIYQEEYFSGDITLSFSFYGGEDANYSALARGYREYLIENGTITEKQSSTPRLNIGLTGKIAVEKSIAGIGYQSTETVTSFTQALEIVKQLKDLGAEDIGITYSSWFGGGLATAIPNSASPAAGMGGKKALSALINEIGEENLSLGTSVLKIWQGFPNINPLKYANRTVANKADKDYRYSVATNLPQKDGASYYTLDARYVSSLISKYTASTQKLGAAAVALEDLGTTLSTNFQKGNQLPRENAKALVTHALSGISKDTSLTLTSPNIYAAGFADTVLALPTKSSDNNLSDCSIPFMQIVLSGCVDYTVPSVNGLGTPKQNVLKAVETGSQLYFDWIYASDEVVAEFEGAEPQLMFSRNYENWIEFAAEEYTRIKNELGGICTGGILSHEGLADGVWRTTWENGSVIVNYNEREISVEGITVPAQNFVVTEKR